MINMSEQWINGGNCKLCRKKNYCSKQCSANKRYVQHEYQKVALSIGSQVLNKLKFEDFKLHEKN